MKRGMALLVILSLMLGFGLTVLTDFDRHSTLDRHTYEGKVLLDDSEYNELKRQLAHPEVEITTLDVFSSEEHLVNFKVQAPAEAQLSYGEITFTEWEHTPIWNASVALVILGIVAIAGILTTYAIEE